MLTVAIFALLVQEKEDVWIGTVYPETHPPVIRDRVEFKKNYYKIQDGMTTDELVAILDEPDDVIVSDVHDWESNSPMYDVWKYGSVSKYSFTAYGAFTIVDGHVRTRMGMSSVGATWHNERELFDAIQAISEVWAPPRHDESIDLRKAIQVANQLISMGEEGALAVVEEYTWLEQHCHFSISEMWMLSTEVLFLTHLLFTDQSGAPVENIKFVGGVPVYYSSYETCGSAGPGPNLAGTFKEAQKKYKFRSEPIRPSENLTELIDWVELKKDGETPNLWRVRRLATLFGRVCEPPKREKNYSHRDDPYSVATYLEELRNIKVRWDVDTSSYEPVGKSPLDNRRKLFLGFKWSPGSMSDYGLSVRMSKSWNHQVSFSLLRALESSRQSEELPKIVVYIVDIKDEKLIAYASTVGDDWSPKAELTKGSEFEAYDYDEEHQALAMPVWMLAKDTINGYGGGNRAMGKSWFVEEQRLIFEGQDHSFRFIVEIGGKTYKSPILKP